MADIARALKPLLPEGYEVVLFGSRAARSARAGSDWDIGVLGPQPLDGPTLERMREALEEIPTLHTLDLVDLADVPEQFRKLALKDAVRIA